MLESLLETRRTSSTRYLTGAGSLTQLRAWLDPLPARVPIIADADAWRAHGEEIAETLAPAQVVVQCIHGEIDKELDAVERLAAGLATQRVRRREKILVVGGGACCDLGGLVALLYMRGMDYAIVATSLMAQVDAAIGGKVGCNGATRKNLLGGFHGASLVVMDPRFLSTVPPRYARAALAEVVKLGLILPESDVLDYLDAYVNGNENAITPMVARCVDGKLSLLADDPTERDLDRLLNLGHAVAHALEKVCGIDIVHGEAVAVGIAATARYAAIEGHCLPENAERIANRLRLLGLPVSSDVDFLELCDRLGEIPDHRGGHMRLVVPTGDRGVRITRHTNVALLARCVSPRSA